MIHHFSTLDRRKKAVSELIRITRPGGKIFIQVWEKKHNGANDSMIAWKLPTKTNPNKISEVLYRYYYLFTCGELESLVGDLEDRVELLDSFNDRDNWCIIIKKKW